VKFVFLNLSVCLFLSDDELNNVSLVLSNDELDILTYVCLVFA